MTERTSNATESSGDEKNAPHEQEDAKEEDPKVNDETLSEDVEELPLIDVEEEEEKTDPQQIEELEMLEALLYLQARPVARKEIAEVLQVSEEDVKELIEILRDRYYRREAPYVIQEEEDSYYLRLKDEIVRQLKGVVVRKAIPRPALRILAYIAFHEYVREEIVLQSHLVRSFGKGVVERLDYLQRLGFIQLIPHGRTVEVRTTKQLFYLLGVTEESKEAMKNYIQQGLKKYILKMAAS